MKEYATPGYFWALSDSEKYQYRCMQATFALLHEKSCRNQRVSHFNKALETIKSFTNRGDSNGLQRGFVCGLIWLPEGIAVNTYSLMQLMSKCKSSVNGSLQRIGLVHTMNRTKMAGVLSKYFPFIKKNTGELRKWTIRSATPFESNSDDSSIQTSPLLEDIEEIQTEKKCQKINIISFEDEDNLLFADFRNDILNWDNDFSLN